jgi:hypothetical protein
MIECFKTHSVQILGLKFYDPHAPTIPMASIKLLLAISAHTDLDLFYMNTTTAWYDHLCNPPSSVDLGLGSNDFPSKWKLLAPLNYTYTAAISWTQSSSTILSLCFDSISFVSRGAFWMHNHSPGELLLCTHCHVDEFFLSAITLSLARQCYAIYKMSHDCRFSIAGNFDCLILFGFKMLVNYLCQLLSLTIFLCKMMVESQLIVKFSSGLVLLLVLVTKNWNWIFMELLDLDCLFWYSSAWQCLLAPLFRIGSMSRVNN